MKCKACQWVQRNRDPDGKTLCTHHEGFNAAIDKALEIIEEHQTRWAIINYAAELREKLNEAKQ